MLASMLACEREPRSFDLGVVGVAERSDDALLGRMDDEQLELEHARIAELIQREGLHAVYAADREQIAFADDTRGLVVVRSAPISVVVVAAK